MRRSAVVGLLLLALAAGALEVDERELEELGTRSIDFINYEGPYDRIDTVAQIVGIGRALGASVGVGYSDFSLDMRYRVIHAVDPLTTRGLDADIIVPLPASRVDHIDNLRRIISGFLQSAYGYSEADGALIARWVTIYNAVVRGNMEFYTARYKPVVIRHLTPENAGLSRRYDEWPGRSRIVIPLTSRAAPGVVGTVDPAELADERVIEQLRTEPDLGVTDRQALVDLTERVIDEREAAIERAALELRREQERLAAEERALAEERRRLEEERAALALTEREAAEREQEIARRAAEAEEERRVVDERLVDLAEERREVAVLIERVRDERERIARDARTLLDERQITDDIRGLIDDLSPVYFLQVRSEEGVVLGQLVQINPVTGLIINRSREDRIVSRTYQFYGAGLLTIVAQDGDGRLALFDVDTLGELRRGAATVHLASMLDVHGSPQSAYAVVQDQGEWFLGQFGTDLSLVRRSLIPVNPYTTMAFSGSVVWVQTADDKIVALNLQDLRVVP